MTYRIVKTDGTILVELGDGLVDRTSSSITFIGKNVVNFGQSQNSDLLHMLENFAYSIPPASPLTGQLWYDTTNSSLKVYNGYWQSLSTMISDSVAPTSYGQGGMWFNTATNQLNVKNGNDFVTIGPDAIAGFGTTRMASVSVRDTYNDDYAVIQCILNGEVVAIISGVAFNVSSNTPIAGFAQINRGLTLKNYNSLDVSILGNSSRATYASKLLDEAGTAQLSASTATMTSTIVQRDSSGSTKLNKLVVNTLVSSSGAGVLNGIWSVDTSLIPSQASGISLGTTVFPWGSITGKNISATSVNSTNITATAMTATTVTFSNLRSTVNNTNITTIDADPNLTSASDATLATQKAIKSYIDSEVQKAITAFSTTSTSLQNQINSFGFPIPAGTVFYTASPVVPAGYIAANGAIVGKDQYPNLYTALGGVNSPYGQSGLTFTVPDLRGVFVRGLDSGSGRDPDTRTTGSIQQSELGSHNHIFPGDDQLSYASGVAGWTNRTVGTFGYDARSALSGGGQLWRTADTGITETRPINIALMAIIKF